MTRRQIVRQRAAETPFSFSLLDDDDQHWQCVRCLGVADGCRRAKPASTKHLSLYKRVYARLLTGWRNRAMSFKAIAFAFIGVVNTVVDYCVFLTARALLDRWPVALAFVGSVSDFRQCGNAPTISLIAANTVSWIVAISGSYIVSAVLTPPFVTPADGGVW